MSSVTKLTHFLTKLDPQKSIYRQVFLNYLKVYSEPQIILDSALVNNFFSFIINYPYWQSQTQQLGESIQQDLDKFLKENNTSLDSSKILYPHLHQLVSLDFNQDFEFLLRQKEEPSLDSGDRQKVTLISESQGLIATLRKRGGLEIRVFNRLAKIQDGKLTLWGPVTDLKYTMDLELVADQIQVIECPMTTSACFKITEQGCQGVLVRSHLLQKFENLTLGHLNQHSELFYGLKRIEKHYINPHSDPYYKDLVAQLERVEHLLKQNHPEGRRLAPSLLQKSKAALKNIFPNDKLLTILVTNVEFSLISAVQASQNQESWINHSKM